MNGCEPSGEAMALKRTVDRARSQARLPVASLDAPIDNHGANDAQNEHDDTPAAHGSPQTPAPVAPGLLSRGR
jgi:hypothetical protein